jgi:hypothetical protein
MTPNTVSVVYHDPIFSTEDTKLINEQAEVFADKWKCRMEAKGWKISKKGYEAVLENMKVMVSIRLYYQKQKESMKDVRDSSTVH